MSDLVERVARAMIEGEDDSLSPTDKWRARAAIKAVAEWIEHQEEGDLDFIKFQLRRAANEQ